MNTQNDATTNSLNSLKDQIANLTLQISIMNKEMRLLIVNNTQLHSDLVQLQSQTDLLESQIVTLQTENNQLKDQIVQLQSQVDQLRATAYDDVWLAALSTLQVGAYDGAKIQSAMLTVASNYYGATGWNGLYPSGDRIRQTYQIGKVVPEGAGSIWVLAGTWDEFTDRVTWTSVP